MLFFHITAFFCFFLFLICDMIMYIVIIVRAIKKITKNSKTLYVKTIIDELDFLKEQLLVNKTSEEERFVIGCN